MRGFRRFLCSALLAGTVSLVGGPASAGPSQTIPLEVDTVVDGVDGVIWSVAHAPDGRFFYSVRETGDVFVSGSGDEPELLLNVADACRDCGEGGLMGLATSPTFADDGQLYAMYTYRGASTQTGIANRVVRIDTRTGEVDGTVIDEIPGGTTHDGGRLRFGPDNMLYVSTGDGRNTPNPAQDTSNLAGKILRVSPTGGPPEVFSYGHRNPQGLDFRADGTLFAMEHGPGCRDELNLITRGTNYGWTGDEGCPPSFPDDSARPVQVYTPTSTIAPSGAAFYDASLIPQWTGSFFFTTLKDQTLYRVQLADDGRSVTSEQTLFGGSYGRLRSVSEGPDGALWLSTDAGQVLRIHPPGQASPGPPPSTPAPPVASSDVPAAAPEGERPVAASTAKSDDGSTTAILQAAAASAAPLIGVGAAVWLFRRRGADQKS